MSTEAAVAQLREKFSRHQRKLFSLKSRIAKDYAEIPYAMPIDEGIVYRIAGSMNRKFVAEPHLQQHEKQAKDYIRTCADLMREARVLLREQGIEPMQTQADHGISGNASGQSEGDWDDRMFAQYDRMDECLDAVDADFERLGAQLDETGKGQGVAQLHQQFITLGKADVLYTDIRDEHERAVKALMVHGQNFFEKTWAWVQRSACETGFLKLKERLKTHVEDRIALMDHAGKLLSEHGGESLIFMPGADYGVADVEFECSFLSNESDWMDKENLAFNRLRECLDACEADFKKVGTWLQQAEDRVVA